MDDFKVEMEAFCNANVSMFKSPKEFVGKELTVAGVITDLEHRVSRQGKGWASFTLEDYVDSYEFRIVGEDYLKFKHFIILNNFIHMKILDSIKQQIHGQLNLNQKKIKDQSNYNLI